jgi:hypothetical protein
MDQGILKRTTILDNLSQINIAVILILYVIYVSPMKNSHLTILIIGSVFSATAIGLGIATFSRLKKEHQRKRLKSGNNDRVEYNLRQRRDELTTVKPHDTEIKTVSTIGTGLEGEKARRVRRYKSDGRPVYE